MSEMLVDIRISEHKKIVSDNFLCRKFLFGIFMHPKIPTNEEEFFDCICIQASYNEHRY